MKFFVYMCISFLQQFHLCKNKIIKENQKISNYISRIMCFLLDIIIIQIYLVYLNAFFILIRLKISNIKKRNDSI